MTTSPFSCSTASTLSGCRCQCTGSLPTTRWIRRSAASTRPCVILRSSTTYSHASFVPASSSCSTCTPQTFRRPTRACGAAPTRRARRRLRLRLSARGSYSRVATAPRIRISSAPTSSTSPMQPRGVWVWMARAGIWPLRDWATRSFRSAHLGSSLSKASRSTAAGTLRANLTAAGGARISRATLAIQ